MKVGKATMDTPRIKLGIYGPSGAGKTAFGAVAYTKSPAGVAVVCAETQAKAIIGTWNPDATVLEVNTYADIRLAYEWLARGFRTGFVHEHQEGPGGATWTQTSDPFVIETVVIDSASDIFRTLKGAVMAEEVAKAKQRWRERKGGNMEGFDGEDDIGQHGWDVLQRRFIDTMRAFRDLPCHLVAIYALDEREDKALGTVSKPYVQGRDLKASVPGLYNSFSYVYRRPATAEERSAGRSATVREAAFALDERYQTKGLDGLDAVEPLDFKAWHRKFSAFASKVASARDAKAKKAAAAGAQDSAARQDSNSNDTTTGQKSEESA